MYSSTIPDLQFLIQMCADYAHKWGFYLVLKNKMYDNRISRVICCQSVEHQWKLGNNIIENVSSMYFLGVAFNNNLKNSTRNEMK